MKEKETRFGVKPVEAVADAMMVAVYKQIGQEWNFCSDTDIKTILKESTKENCRISSAMVLGFLEEKYPTMFRVKLVIEEVDDRGVNLANGWGWHDYFLVLGADEVWYAGSPANYGVTEGEDRVEKLIYSRNLANVLDQIRRFEGGKWPGVRDIHRAIGEGIGETRVKLYANNDDQEVNFLLLSRDDWGTSGRRVSVKIDGVI